MDHAVRMRIAEAAEGHPLYAEEITGLLVDEGRLVLKDGRWVATTDLSDVPVPPTISALLSARLDKLPTDERRLIEIASVMGQVFYASAVRAMAGGEPDAVGSGITSLVRKQFVRPERSDIPETEALAFRHLLLRDAAYDAHLEGRARRPARTVRRLVGRCRRIARRAGRDRRLPPRTGVPLPRRAGSSRRTRAAAGRRGRSAPGGRGRTATAARSDYAASVNLLSRASALLDPDDPLRLEHPAGSRRRRSVEAGDMDGAEATFDEAIERAVATRVMSRCACTPSSKRWLTLSDSATTRTSRARRRASARGLRRRRR